jgi:hypothetical protein
MSIFESALFQSILETPFISRVRRNHGLEHATLHILAKRYPGQNMGGHSDHKGFWLIGNIPTEGIQQAVEEALQRLRGGEHHLAVHPSCGTNFATAGVLAGMAGVVGMWGAGPRKRDKVERVPLVATLATLALIVAQPLGLSAQKYFTTSGELGDLEVVEIVATKRGRMTAHRVTTRG